MTLVRASGRYETKRNHALVMADPVFDASDERLRDAARQITQAPERDREPSQRRVPDKDAVPTLSLPRLPESEKLGKNLKGILGASCALYTGWHAPNRLSCINSEGKLSRIARVVFATHGFAANDVPGIMEPVLALTMVPQGTDGFLTMSEVAGLRMDIDIAALTACKTDLE